MSFAPLVSMVVTLFLPVGLWLYYTARVKKGWMYLLFGGAAYLGLQIILRLAFLFVLSYLNPESTAAYLLSALVSSLLSTLGISLIFFVFYRPRLEPYKALGFGLGYAFLETMVLYGVNTLLSVYLGMPLSAGAYYGGCLEALYDMSTTLMMTLFAACFIQHDQKLKLAIVLMLYIATTLVSTLLFNVLGLVTAGYIWLALMIACWIGGLWYREIHEFYFKWWKDMTKS